MCDMPKALSYKDRAMLAFEDVVMWMENLSHRRLKACEVACIILRHQVNDKDGDKLLKDVMPKFRNLIER